MTNGGRGNQKYLIDLVIQEMYSEHAVPDPVLGASNKAIIKSLFNYSDA